MFVANRHNIAAGIGTNMTFLADKNICSKFFFDYMNQPTPKSLKEGEIHVFNFGASINIMF